MGDWYSLSTVLLNYNSQYRNQLPTLTYEYILSEYRDSLPYMKTNKYKESLPMDFFKFFKSENAPETFHDLSNLIRHSILIVMLLQQNVSSEDIDYLISCLEIIKVELSKLNSKSAETLFLKSKVYSNTLNEMNTVKLDTSSQLEKESNKLNIVSDNSDSVRTVLAKTKLYSSFLFWVMIATLIMNYISILLGAESQLLLFNLAVCFICGVLYIVFSF